MDHQSLNDEEKAPPIEELQDFVLDEDPEFSGRVKRSLNRHMLVGDSLEFSLGVFQKTMWEYLKTVVELLPTKKGNKPE